MPKKKRKAGVLAPRRKRMTRAGRLSCAKDTQWVQKYRGKNIVKGYARWFGVDFLSAVTELRQLGVFVSGQREAQLRETMKNRASAAKRKPPVRQPMEFPECNESFAFIAGYTSGGAPYGVTWEEAERMSLSADSPEPYPLDEFTDFDSDAPAMPDFLTDVDDEADPPEW